MHSRIWDTRSYENRLTLSVALVIEEAADFRDSVMAFLRERSWLVRFLHQMVVCAEAGYVRS
jgi:hypothetical protein